MSDALRIEVDGTRLLYWEGVPYVRWPSGRKTNPDGSVRWSFAELVRVVRYWAGPARPFEIRRRPPRGVD